MFLFARPDQGEFAPARQVCVDSPSYARYKSNESESYPHLRQRYTHTRAHALLVPGSCFMAVTDPATRYSSKKALNVESPSFTPSLLQPINKKPTFSSQAVTAPSFTPRGLGGKPQAFPFRTLRFFVLTVSDCSRYAIYFTRYRGTHV